MSVVSAALLLRLLIGRSVQRDAVIIAFQSDEDAVVPWLPLLRVVSVYLESSHLLYLLSFTSEMRTVRTARKKITEWLSLCLYTLSHCASHCAFIRYLTASITAPLYVISLPLSLCLYTISHCLYHCAFIHRVIA